MIRPHDVVGRMGGEEFLFIFPGLQEDEAAATLSRFIDLVSTRAGADLRVSAPLSFLCGVHRLRGGEDCASALKQADNALYRAKRAGRGRVERSDQPAAQERHLAETPGAGAGNLVRLADESTQTSAVLTPADYHVKFGKRITSLGWLGTLKVRRLTDGKIIYPFDGCTDIGPFRTPDEEREAARLLADDLARQDIENPEP
ncbi:GGDEF domain-containing protein [Paraburkholderia sp. Ac-20347]|nr:GGDEF domain-containing protein [Paraburkholderia sp. Ac-20347]